MGRMELRSSIFHLKKKQRLGGVGFCSETDFGDLGPTMFTMVPWRSHRGQGASSSVDPAWLQSVQSLQASVELAI